MSAKYSSDFRTGQLSVRPRCFQMFRRVCHRTGNWRADSNNANTLMKNIPTLDSSSRSVWFWSLKSSSCERSFSWRESFSRMSCWTSWAFLDLPITFCTFPSSCSRTVTFAVASPSAKNARNLIFKNLTCKKTESHHSFDDDTDLPSCNSDSSIRACSPKYILK